MKNSIFATKIEFIVAIYLLSKHNFYAFIVVKMSYNKVSEVILWIRQNG